MSFEAVGDLWWKNAIVYCVDTQFFLDTRGDGVGDLDGLTQRIDYLAGLGDLVEPVRTAHERGIRVIADLVINHTSIDHPWFQTARNDRDSIYHGCAPARRLHAAGRGQ
ncbi:MAG: alpha-amylase family glycosyl hydrolase [Thiogranum sp.]|nr:alpha-amylase family glycosyl hydrolase [Thiogranum sp.]